MLLFLYFLLCCCNFSSGTEHERVLKKPIQLVRPNASHTGLEVVEESLLRIQEILDPVATVSVVGPYHSGKSFLLNQIAEHDDSSRGFQIGSHVDPKTMGIWVWGGERQTLKDGSVVSVLYLDTEGFSSSQASQHYDSQIFAVSTLLSSLLIYNTVKIIDQNAIDYLELLTTQTQMFSLNTQLHSEDGSFDMNMIKFPPLIWVVQDFFQQIDDEETPQLWLKRLLDSQKEQNLRQLTKLFPSVDCHTLFLPATTQKLLTDLSLSTESDLTEEYKIGRQELKDLILEKISAKKQKVVQESVVKGTKKLPMDSTITGPGLATLLKLLVKGTNEGKLAEVPSIWKRFIEEQADLTKEQCFQYYKKYLEPESKKQGAPMSKTKIFENHERVRKNSLILLKDLVLGLEKVETVIADDLKMMIDKEWESFLVKHLARIEEYCQKQVSSLVSQFNENVKFQLPMATEDITSKIDIEKESIEQLYHSNLDEYNDIKAKDTIFGSLEEILFTERKNILSRNSEAMDSLFNEAVDQGIKSFDDTLETESESRGKARSRKSLLNLKKKAEKIGNEVFDERVELFSGEKNKMKKYQDLLSEKIIVSWKDIQNYNDKLAQNELQFQLNKSIEDLKRVIKNKVKYPLDTSVLNDILDNRTRECLEKFDNFLSHSVFDMDEIVNEIHGSLVAAVSKIKQIAAEDNLSAIKEIVKKYCDATEVKVKIDGYFSSWLYFVPKFIPYSPMSMAIKTCADALDKDTEYGLEPTQKIEVATWFIEKYQSSTSFLAICCSFIVVFVSYGMARFVIFREKF